MMQELFTDYTLRTVALGAGLLGLVSGALGAFAVLRRQALLGDAISHAALPGIALAFLVTGSKAPLVLVVGAALAGWLGAALIASVTQRTKVTYDSALGIMLSVFFGIGLVMLTYIQRMPATNQAGLDSFLFGQAAALVTRDVQTIGFLGVLVLVVVALFWKEFKLLSFDAGFAGTLGFPVSRLDRLLTALLVVAIVIGLQTVGVVLMSAMIVAPGAAARQWTNRLGTMVLLSGFMGAVSGVGGAIVSARSANVPTGPAIVLLVSGVVVFSLLLAPERGLLWRRLREWREGRALRVDAVLADLYAMASQHESSGHPHSRRALDVMSETSASTRKTLRLLRVLGLARRVDRDHWALTHEGVERAQRVMRRQYGGGNADGSR